MQRSLILNLPLSLLLCLLLCAPMACSSGSQENAPEATTSDDTEATAPRETPTFSSDFESGDTGDWSANKLDEEGAEEAESED